MKRFISMLVIIALICNIILPLQSVKASNEIPTGKKMIEELKTQPPQDEVEETEKRTANSKVFRQKNGAHKLEISADPIHFKDPKTKKWK